MLSSFIQILFVFYKQAVNFVYLLCSQEKYIYDKNDVLWIAYICLLFEV